MAGTDLAHSRSLINVSLYVILVNQDLTEFAGDMVAAIGDDRRKFVARYMAVLLAQAANELPALLGASLRGSLTALGASEALFAELNAVGRQFGQFRSQHADFLNEVRNLVAAHRDRNALMQVEVIQELNPVEVLRLASEFSVPFGQLVAILTKAVQDHMSIRGLMVDMLSKGGLPPRLSRAALKRQQRRRRL